jgi:hypothetical protein
MPIVLLLAASLTVVAPPLDHSAFDALLREHVAEGLVDYDAFARSPQLGRYLDQLATAKLDGLSDPELLAFWINVYNAYTIQLINAHEERDSIRNINKTLGLLPLKGRSRSTTSSTRSSASSSTSRASTSPSSVRPSAVPRCAARPTRGLVSRSSSRTRPASSFFAHRPRTAST